MMHDSPVSNEQSSVHGAPLTHRDRLRSPETLTLAALLIASALSLLFLGALVAEPKALFGRSLSAIPPSLFPMLVLSALVVLSAIALILQLRGMVPDEGIPMSAQQWARAAALFGIMLLYALIMTSVGFLISTIIAVSLISLLMGARSVLQIAAVAITGPVLLYLASTRLLAVSLPELDVIESIYAAIPGL
ncbi:tripartite tricarboxylate transporter TctB family protein [Citreicella sp. C3M06]|uniref:tripartite tricarboxylate transporter TctB family protein n=1 Tax=Roseobacteraceae TaxID=2854170 RepID=UPI001C093D81|nr:MULTISPECIES: tripartite tricarboxylate transporter TctB family protein [Roseobacteraceae]MBU2959269.1 tripartite tricarboxylate transporter TctB family protein [Citreicella sp. C3M06]MDO6585200.1 tripartite tricarboxylate transporter TctB family protein [Salipiger sp. 1_MG-2023]